MAKEVCIVISVMPAIQALDNSHYKLIHTSLAEEPSVSDRSSHDVKFRLPIKKGHMNVLYT